MDINEIKRLLPHRYPFLLVDRVLEIDACKRIVAIKNLTVNEPFFQGHFPGAPTMPGVLMIEALAQAGAILIINQLDGLKDRLVYLAGVDKARFRQTVIPGDQLKLTVECTKLRPKTCKMHGVAEVDGKVAAECDLLSVMVDRSGS